MNKERKKAIEAFVQKQEVRNSLANGITEGFQKYPEIVKDKGLRDGAFKIALTQHKIILLEQGVTYGDVFRITSGVKESIAERNGKKEYIARINGIWSTRNKQQVEENSDYETESIDTNPVTQTGTDGSSVLEQDKEVSLV